MNERDELCLPDVLPCPVPGRCNFHESLFGSESAARQIPNDWQCEKCGKAHPTILRPSPGSSQSSNSTLESLPAELLQHIANYLPLAYRAAMTFVSRTTCLKLGTEAWSKLEERVDGRHKYIYDREAFLTMLRHDMPAYAACDSCSILRHYQSQCSWPLLRHNRETRGIKPPVYAPSNFLIQRILDYCLYGSNNGICLSFLSCNGRYDRPITSLVEDAPSFLTINYQAEARIFENNVITHITYRVALPKPWYSLDLQERYQIISRLYLCPHTYASKLQYRDPTDPTYPSDSSIAISLYQGEDSKDVNYACRRCATDFQAKWGPEPEIVIQAWNLNSGKRCNDGEAMDMVHCATEYDSNPMRVGRIREMFAAGRDC